MANLFSRVVNSFHRRPIQARLFGHSSSNSFSNSSSNSFSNSSSNSSSTAKVIPSMNYGFPLGKKLLQRKYHFQHPVHGKITVCICKKKPGQDKFELLIRQKKHLRTLHYKQDMRVMDVDEAQNLASTLRFDSKILYEDKERSGIIDNEDIKAMFNIAATDAMHAMGAMKLVSDNETTDNHIIDIHRMQYHSLKALKGRNWLPREKDLTHYFGRSLS